MGKITPIPSYANTEYPIPSANVFSINPMVPICEPPTGLGFPIVTEPYTMTAIMVITIIIFANR